MQLRSEVIRSCTFSGNFLGACCQFIAILSSRAFIIGYLNDLAEKLPEVPSSVIMSWSIFVLIYTMMHASLMKDSGQWSVCVCVGCMM